ncbi:ProQ/FINO family protein [Halomonas kalidii]|uniref:ProQ/FINO family protein n=1 Tax=Halomonas kalidii TaxID=3043293 RepID=A0ABT6VLC0_9GAMM|nr:ProQ/FINO family protein [Halomonas kalidii]MDI5934760.1 ProQ/FINO family protein [Halomonas kalidii]
MIEERSTRLLEALESRAESLLGTLHEARVQQAAMQARLAELERRRSELEARNAELVARAEEALASQRGLARRNDDLELRLAEFEANRLELLEENRELDEQNRELEEHNRHLHDKLAAGEPAGGFPLPARRAQGLSALIGHRPKGAAARVAPAPPEAGQPAPAEPARNPQSDLPIGEAPSPQALLAEWYQRYGSTFFKGHTRPLKVGIHEELAAREPWPEKLVRRALACYVNLPRYLKSVREDAERIDLDGQAAGRVDAEAAEHARKKLERLQANRRKPQGKPQRHPGRAEGRPSGSQMPAGKPASRAGESAGDATAAPSPATLEEKLSALLAKHNGH